MRRWLEERSIQTKLILSYTVLGLLPMLLIAVYICAHVSPDTNDA